MKLLLINSIGKSKWGGGEKWMITTAIGLIQRGHQVYIGCHKGSIIETKATESKIPVVYIPINSDFSLIGAIHLWQFAQKYGPDVIIGCQNRDIRIAGAIRYYINNPLIISRQGVKLISNNWKYKLSFRWFCDGIITNTQTIKNDYDSYGWWNQDYVKVIHNGISPQMKVTSQFDFNSFFQPAENPRIVLSAGRLTQQKGFEYLIEAASWVCKERKDIFFFIAGKGRLEKKLKNLIEAKQLIDRVFIIGFQNDLTPLLQKSDLFVLSSLYEGMPNVIMEAMVQKVPVISTNVNGVTELIENETTGYIIPASNSEKMAEKILEFFNQDDNNEIIDRAFEHITSKFKVDTMLDKIETYLDKKLEERRK